jgi:hypothetical protein
MIRTALAGSLLISTALAAWSTPARADRDRTPDRSSSATDGVYGRFDGDLDLSLAAGVELLRGGPGATAMARAIYLGTASVYVGYATSFGDLSAVPPRSFGFGVGLRPFFLPRWANDRERGPAILDLTIDATTFDLGVLWSADQLGHFNQAAGFEFAIGTEVPLIGQAEGPWLGVRGALRWQAWELAASETTDPAGLGPAVYFTLAWHTLVNAHIVDAGDRIVRD